MVNQMSDYTSAIQEGISSLDLFNSELNPSTVMDKVKDIVMPIATTALVEGGRQLATNAYNLAKMNALKAVGGLKDQLMDAAKEKAGALMKQYGATDEEVESILEGNFSKAMATRVSAIVARGKAVVQGETEATPATDATDATAETAPVAETTAVAEQPVASVAETSFSTAVPTAVEAETVVAPVIEDAIPMSLEDVSTIATNLGRTLLTEGSDAAIGQAQAIGSSIFRGIASKVGSVFDNVKSVVMSKVSDVTSELPDLEGLSTVSPFDIPGIQTLGTEAEAQFSALSRGFQTASDALTDDQFATATNFAENLGSKGILLGKTAMQSVQTNTSENMARAFNASRIKKPPTVEEETAGPAEAPPPPPAPVEEPPAPVPAEEETIAPVETPPAVPVTEAPIASEAETIAPSIEEAIAPAVEETIIPDTLDSVAATVGAAASQAAADAAAAAAAAATGAVTSGLEAAAGATAELPGIGEIAGPLLAVVGALAGIFTSNLFHHAPPKPTLLNPSTQFL